MPGIKDRKFAFILFLLIFAHNICSSQEFSIGGTFGTSADYAAEGEDQFFIISGLAEYRPYRSLFSINTEPGLIVANEKLIFSAPLYAKMIIGDKLRFAPATGVFIRTNSKYGWMAGLSLEYILENKLGIFLKGDYYMDYWQDITPRQNEFVNSDGSLWISIGMKKNIRY